MWWYIEKKRTFIVAWSAFNASINIEVIRQKKDIKKEPKTILNWLLSSNPIWSNSRRRRRNREYIGYYKNATKIKTNSIHLLNCRWLTSIGKQMWQPYQWNLPTNRWSTIIQCPNLPTRVARHYKSIVWLRAPPESQGNPTKRCECWHLETPKSSLEVGFLKAMFSGERRLVKLGHCKGRIWGKFWGMEDFREEENGKSRFSRNLENGGNTLLNMRISF